MFGQQNREMLAHFTVGLVSVFIFDMSVVFNLFLLLLPLRYSFLDGAITWIIHKKKKISKNYKHTHVCCVQANPKCMPSALDISFPA